MTNPNPTPVEPTVPVVPTEPTPTETTIPKHRFDEVYGKMKTISEELEAYKANEAKRQKEALEATQQFETLYKTTATEHEALKATYASTEAKANSYEAVIRSMVDTKLTSIPAEYHDLIPANLSTSEKLDWLNKAETKGLFGVPNVVQAPIGQPTNVPHATPEIATMSAMEKLTSAFTKK